MRLLRGVAAGRVKPRLRSPGTMFLAGLALIAALALASPAIGGQSVGKLAKQVKKLKTQVAEIAKQEGPVGAAGAVGPRGAAGPRGPAGQQGAAGTAKAFAYVSASGTVTESHSQGVTAFRETDGTYCLNVEFAPKNIVATIDAFSATATSSISASIVSLPSCTLAVKTAEDGAFADSSFFVLVN